MLTEEQETAVDKATKRLKAGHSFKLGGWAGTGKSYSCGPISEEIPYGMACAYTGKAALRLGQSGLDASTIHSLIYEYDAHTKKFHLKECVDGEWFLVDEASMISQKIKDDLEHFGLPILWVGDPGQLEPVGKDAFLMAEPDYTLETIHRQAANSGILHFAEDVRLRRPLAASYQDVQVHRYAYPDAQLLTGADMVICAFNRTRAELNRTVRAYKGYSDVLEKGERLIITRNHRETGLRNGQILTVVWYEAGKHWIKAKLVDPVSRMFHIITFRRNLLGVEKQPSNLPFSEVMVDYAQAISCHKAQGSEWDNVVVLDEQCPRLWDPVRWRYTAATRAAKTLKFYFP